MPNFKPDEELNQLRLVANQILYTLWQNSSYDQIDLLVLYGKEAMKDIEAKARTENTDPNPHGYSRGEYIMFCNVARNNGWEYDNSPGTENSNEFWWAHGGTFEKVREDSLMTRLHDQFCTRKAS